MSRVFVEMTLRLWVSSLRERKQRIRPLFLQERMAYSVGFFLDALPGPERRKTEWMRFLSSTKRAFSSRTAPRGCLKAPRPQLARDMIERAIAADVPFSWVAADSVYGVGKIEMTLRGAGKDYVLGGNATLNSWGDKLLVASSAEEIA